MRNFKEFPAYITNDTCKKRRELCNFIVTHLQVSTQSVKFRENSAKSLFASAVR